MILIKAEGMMIFGSVFWQKKKIKKYCLPDGHIISEGQNSKPENPRVGLWWKEKGCGCELFQCDFIFLFSYLPCTYPVMVLSHALTHVDTFPHTFFLAQQHSHPNLCCGAVLFIVSRVCSFNSAQMLIRHNGCAQLSCVIVCNSVCNVK